MRLLRDGIGTVLLLIEFLLFNKEYDLDVAQVVLLLLTIRHAVLVNVIPNFTELSVDVVTGHQDELNSLVLRIIWAFTPYAQILSQLIPIEAV